MTAEMLAKARKNIEAYRQTSGLDNVEFRLGEIEHLPVADASVDAIISNCVINLSPDKPQVWREIARVLNRADGLQSRIWRCSSPCRQGSRRWLKHSLAALQARCLYPKPSEWLRRRD